MAYNKKIAVISSDRFAGKINEDIWLRDALLSLGEQSEIVSWENKDIIWSDYKSAVLRSCWGYHNRIDDFLKFLEKLDLLQIRLFNDTQIVRWNIQKNLQFKDLNSFGIKTVPTIFLQNDALNFKKAIADNGWEKYESLVIKPDISGSGDRTYIVSQNANISGFKNNLSVEEAEHIFQTFASEKRIRGVMIQPFMPGIFEGEYSFVFIDSELTHIAIRHPGIFGDKKDPVEIKKSQIPNDMMLFADQCQRAINRISDTIKKGYIPLYSRCDIVRSGSQLFLMEAEMAEPDLLIKTISSDQARKNVINKIANSVLERSR